MLHRVNSISSNYTRKTLGCKNKYFHLSEEMNTERNIREKSCLERSQRPAVVGVVYTITDTTIF